MTPMAEPRARPFTDRLPTSFWDMSYGVSQARWLLSSFHIFQVTVMVFPYVSGKTMRTLVADQDFQQRRFVEKALTALGYFRTTSASCFNELVTLTHYSPSLYERFDLLVVSASIFKDRDFDYLDFCFDNSRLKNVLIYDANKSTGELEILSDSEGEQVWLVQGVTLDVVAELATAIEPRLV